MLETAPDHPGSGLILDDKNNPLRAGARPATGQRLLAGRHVKPLNRDITLIIKGIQMFGNGMAAGIAGALGLLDTDFHTDIFQKPADVFLHD